MLIEAEQYVIASSCTHSMKCMPFLSMDFQQRLFSKKIRLAGKLGKFVKVLKFRTKKAFA